MRGFVVGVSGVGWVRALTTRIELERTSETVVAHVPRRAERSSRREKSVLKG